jgi:S-adenosylmethionine synthetase
MGRRPELKTKIFRRGDGSEVRVDVELFPWEKLDRLDEVKRVLGV